MELKDDLINLLLKSPNSGKNKAIAKQIETYHHFISSKHRNDLQGLRELRWSNSNSPFKSILL